MDRLSALPNDILSNILSYLPVQEAVRTSYLSRTWRDIWKSIPWIMIDTKTMDVLDYTNYSATRIGRFLLAHDDTTILSFYVRDVTCDLRDHSDPCLVRIWVDIVLGHSVQDLSVALIEADDKRIDSTLALPDHVFFSTRLLRLQLQYLVLIVPREVGLLQLKSVTLVDIVVRENFTAFIKGCPVLGELYIQNCNWETNVIDLKLKSLRIFMFEHDSAVISQGVMTLNMPNLALLHFKSDLAFNCLPTNLPDSVEGWIWVHNLREETTPRAIQLMSAVSNAISLSIYGLEDVVEPFFDPPYTLKNLQFAQTVEPENE